MIWVDHVIEYVCIYLFIYICMSVSMYVWKVLRSFNLLRAQFEIVWSEIRVIFASQCSHFVQWQQKHIKKRKTFKVAQVQAAGHFILPA